MTVKRTITCDSCNNEIDYNEQLIDAGVYGRHFHFECLAHMSAFDLMYALRLDDIKTFDNDKFIYTSRFKSCQVKANKLKINSSYGKTND